MTRRKIIKSNPVENFDDQHPCVFVLSTGRVGTETLAYLLGLAKNIFAYHEPHPKLFALSKLTYEMKGIYLVDKNIKSALQEGFLTSRQEFLRNSLYCSRGYVETSPQVTFLAPVILDTIPNVKFVHLVRNPHDVVRSGMRRGWYQGHTYDTTRIVPLAGTKFAKVWNNMNPFQKNLWLWAETNRWILEFAKCLSDRNYLCIHSEDIFKKDIDEIARLYEFIGKTMPPERKIAAVLGRKRNIQCRGEFESPDKWLEELDEDLKNMVLPTAAALGYEIV
jgi:hypothetical protein